MNMGPDNPNQVRSASGGAYIHPNQPRLVYLIYRGLRTVSIQASNLKSELKTNTIVHRLQLHSPGITGVSDIVTGPKSLHYEPSPRIATSLLDPTSDSHRTPNPNTLTTFNNPTKAQFIPKQILTKADTATPLKTNRERKRERERERETERLSCSSIRQGLLKCLGSKGSSHQERPILRRKASGKSGCYVGVTGI